MTYNVFGGTLNLTQSINHVLFVLWPVLKQYVFCVAVPSSGRMTEAGNSYSCMHRDTHLFVTSLVAMLSYIFSNCLR